MNLSLVCLCRDLFIRLVYGAWEHDTWFKLKKDVVGMVGFSSIQKCMVAMSMIAYGAPANGQDDYLRMLESTAIKPCIDSAERWWLCLARTI